MISISLKYVVSPIRNLLQQLLLSISLSSTFISFKYPSIHSLLTTDFGAPQSTNIILAAPLFMRFISITTSSTKCPLVTLPFNISFISFIYFSRFSTFLNNSLFCLSGVLHGILAPVLLLVLGGPVNFPGIDAVLQFEFLLKLELSLT